jgi:hypothetical protein
VNAFARYPSTWFFVILFSFSCIFLKKNIKMPPKRTIAELNGVEEKLDDLDALKIEYKERLGAEWENKHEEPDSPKVPRFVLFCPSGYTLDYKHSGSRLCGRCKAYRGSDMGCDCGCNYHICATCVLMMQGERRRVVDQIQYRYRKDRLAWAEEEIRLIKRVLDGKPIRRRLRRKPAKEQKDDDSIFPELDDIDPFEF